MNTNTEDSDNLAGTLTTKNTVCFLLQLTEGCTKKISVEFFVMDSKGDLKFFNMTAEAVQSKILSGTNKNQFVSTSNIGGSVDGILHSIYYPNGTIKGLMLRIYARMEKALDGDDKIFVRSSSLKFDTFADIIYAKVTDDKKKEWELIKAQPAPQLNEVPVEMPW